MEVHAIGNRMRPLKASNISIASILVEQQVVKQPLNMNSVAMVSDAEHTVLIMKT